MYEAIPMAYLMQQAGGLASNGQIPILDIQPEQIHQRTPVYLGSKNDVEDLLAIIKKHSSWNNGKSETVTFLCGTTFCLNVSQDWYLW